MYTCSYSSNPIYLPFDASPSEHVNIFYFTLNYRDFANYRFRKLQFRKLQISQITDFANCRFRKLQISQTADFVSFRFVNYSKPYVSHLRVTHVIGEGFRIIRQGNKVLNVLYKTVFNIHRHGGWSYGQTPCAFLLNFTHT